MNDLAERKRLLVAQADLHRSLIALERLQWQQRIADTAGQLQGQRWWLIGGAAVAGWFVMKRLGGIVRWVPVVLTVAKIVQNFKK